MNIGLLNVRILFQKNEVTMDENGNHINTWADFYFCNATVSGELGNEKDEVAITLDTSDISFTIRYCKTALQLENIGFRVVFQDSLYDILAIDHMNFKKKAIKVRCKKVRR